ncbi:transcription-repair-coupling factor [Variibacter gotjawalensis]|uniref:Transcription-repair-coupling factor n=1 Tax=Variibacter gotjawalensis TaxID=1333996 RepID=A0A0S3PXZ4_9BRAD|nr:transcription-repair coupling factor [Variibacter gotjawalensis]NIK46472.1 transcription-repair coupling factor (superfamily II helicase) [Variibacter gotjawalensis]RZS48382.1 transcription-repair coupling factor [Variibacter gotjawalensis]BAT60640.1 transcription-repair-coupling factor [Variibacter gotjawalensis]
MPKSVSKSPAELLAPGRHLTLSRVTEGAEGLVLADLARAAAARPKAPAITLVTVCRDGPRMAALTRALGFFAPDIDVIEFPAWDCQPYDRVSPHASISAQRMMTLSRLANVTGRERPSVLLTTVNAILQRVPPRQAVATQSFSAAPGNMLDMQAIVKWLELNGYTRASTVREPADYAVRGGIIDLFPPGLDLPIRLDFFGDTLETIRSFDPESQRTVGQLRTLDLVPVAEFQLTTETIRRFRQRYTEQFGAPTRDDTLYEAISEGRRYPGMEHWLPLFHTSMDTLFDYVPDSPIVLGAMVEDAARERFATITDYYEARKEIIADAQSGPPYKPLKPDALYLTDTQWKKTLDDSATVSLSAFATPESANVVDVETRQGHNFAAERAEQGANVFEALAKHVNKLQGGGKRVAVALWSEGSRDRMSHVLGEHGLNNLAMVPSWPEALKQPKHVVSLGVVGLESGFESDDFAIISEQDILGDRLVRTKRTSKRAQDFLQEVGALTHGDLVVHVDHGIGRFVGLRAIEVTGAPHDCLEIHYADAAKLFLPVENIELLSRYGSEETTVQLDRLGGGGWQARKARMKQRIREMAGALIRVAAERQLREAPKLTVPAGLYDEFCASFPYEETEDQAGAIDAVLGDLAAGRPMDRLICGDVGFGKTEVALRAAFATAMSGKQVAVVVPTTLLARQHFKTFSERFRGFPLRVAQASRLVNSAELKVTKQELTEGKVDIIVGTHALLGKTIKFNDLGLIIVDEEQHFGVAHKEKLKQLRAEVHVLTLTATPIPRTLQLALTGVRELSIIASPPVDRLTVRTFISPFDPLSVREALLRERYRGGQSFYVCPRIEDLASVKDFLDKNVPEVRVAVAHGQMAPGVLEDIMTAFYDGKYEVLLSTTIVESGLDIPNANTLIVHRADRLGLAQLYQLRGRVGRSKLRAFSLFTLPAEKKITPQAERRLKVLQSLDTLGAGFQLASHDLDIRGAGNLLGEEQSGHIKEVGYELYQQMLEEAVMSLKAGISEPISDKWSPQITIGTPVLLPEEYVADLNVRLTLYRRLSELEDEREIDAFGAELIDRFGPSPEEVRHLLKIVVIKALCRRANVEKVEAGPKGAVLQFRDNAFANPDGLVAYIREEGPAAKVRPDMKVVFFENWDQPEKRLAGTLLILRTLVAIAERAKAA